MYAVTVMFRRGVMMVCVCVCVHIHSKRDLVIGHFITKYKRYEVQKSKLDQRGFPLCILDKIKF